MKALNKPKVIAIQPEPHVLWDLHDNILVVGFGEKSLQIDLAERQSSSQEVVDITQGAMGLMEGIYGPYVLSAEIPPRRYEDDGTTPIPLDMAAVTVLLWTVQPEVSDSPVPLFEDN
jgi:hypothetical protein